MVNFNDALNTKMAEIERPPNIPIGTYTAVVSKIPSIETISDNKWDVCDFMMQLVEPGEDVDADDLATYGGLGKQSVIRHRFMFDRAPENEAAFKRTLFNLKRFLLDHLRIEGTDDSNLKELLNASVNQRCLVFVKWRADKNDAETMYNEISRTAPLE